MNTLIKSIFAIFVSFMMLNASAATPESELLGTGDILKVTVFEQPDLSLEVRVSETGTITYPLIGTVKVGGGTSAAAERKIEELLEKGGFLKSPHVSIIVPQLQSQQVSVLGQVNRAGRYPLDGVRTIADALAMAGGVSVEGGDLITLVHTKDGQTTREVIDLAEMMRSGNIERNLAVAGGDILYVERAYRFYIYGEVQRPGQYRLEHNMTVLQALSVGGGLSLRGTERGVKVKRLDESGFVTVIKAKHDDLLKPNDVVYVEESLF